MVQFLKSVFGALGEARSGAPAEMKIGDSIVMVSDGGGARQVFPALLYVYVESADAAYQRAISSAPARSRSLTQRLTATVEDQWGNMWQIATYGSASAWYSGSGFTVATMGIKRLIYTTSGGASSREDWILEK
jgi:PhnB protein